MIEKTSWFKNQSIYQYIRQQAENKKLIKYLEIGGTFSLITIFLVTAIAPTAAAISKLLGEIKSKEVTTNAMRLKLISIVSAQDDYAQAQEKFHILESSYPSNPEFYNAASTFSSITKQSGSTIKRLKYNLNDSQVKQGIYSYGVNLIVDGSYSSLLDTIDRISSGRRLVDINSIIFSQTNKGLSLNLSTKLVYSPIKN